MRKIEQDMISALKSSTNVSVDNTTVSCGEVFLHGHKIADLTEDGKVKINFCGWVTKTTTSRLNTILTSFTNYRVGIKNGQPVLYTSDNTIHSVPRNDWVSLDRGVI
jgi:hypothetical protein